MNKKPMTIYRVDTVATVRLHKGITAASPEEAYWVAEQANWEAFGVHLIETHAVSVRYNDAEGNTVVLDECDLDLYCKRCGAEIPFPKDCPDSICSTCERELGAR